MPNNKNSPPTHGLRQDLTRYGDTDFSLFLRKAFIKGAGYSEDALDRPIVGVVNTASGYNPCHGNAAQLLEALKRGIFQAGGLAIEFPTVSVHESFAYPTSMYLRNLMSIDTEEMIRAQPMDSVVLIGGCDKTVPAQLMGAASANIPAIQLVTGAMLTGSHRGERVGACTDCRRFWALYRGQEIDEAEINEVSGQLVASVGTCSVMGTASTMALVTEALGMMLPGGATPPAVTADRTRHAELTGRQAVRLTRSGQPKPSDIMTAKAFENAFRVLFAIGGSTNGLVHLTAIAGRLGIEVNLFGLDAMARETPVLVDLKPSGQHYMEDLHKAGGLVTILRELKPHLHLKVITVNGKTLGENIDAAIKPFPQTVVKTADRPIYGEGGIAILHGNLAPGGAIIKQAAANPARMEHTGRAVVFSGLDDLARRIDDPDLDVNEDDILVLQNIGPIGAPGMPEAGYIPIPKKLAVGGVKDMVRISDGRMSGTAAGTIVLHVTPEAAIGGPLGFVRNGDSIRLSVRERVLELLVPESELAARVNADKHKTPIDTSQLAQRGYRQLFFQSVLQADQGCDFDFLKSERKTAIVPIKS